MYIKVIITFAVYMIGFAALHSTAAIARSGGGRGPDCNEIGRVLTDGLYEDRTRSTDDSPISWTMATPESQKIDPGKLEEAANKLSFFWGKLPPQVRSFLVVRNNSLVFERYYFGEKPEKSDNVHSASKSIWGAAIGIAIKKGLINRLRIDIEAEDTPIYLLLPDNYRNIIENDVNTNKKRITLRHLLSMRSGISWKEDESEKTLKGKDDWIESILNLPLDTDPGSKFKYSTANSHLVSAILEEAIRKNPERSGLHSKNTCEFIHEHILTKIGIEAEQWGRDRQQYFSGGFDLHLTPRELARFGTLYLNKGRWEGQEIVPEAWISKSLDAQFGSLDSTTPIAKDSRIPTAYGYNFWLGKLGKHSVAMAWGYCGQMIYLFQKLNMLVVITTNTLTFDCGVESWIAYPEKRLMTEFESALELVLNAAE